MRSVPLLLLICLHMASSWAQQMYPKDKAILTAFRNKLKNPKKLPFINCDNLLFFCTPAGRVKSIYLGGLRLDGYLTSSIAQLSFLENIFLQKNNLKGRIPASFARLKNLRVLSLYDNKFSGNVPSFLNSFKKLILLDLSDNYFWGSPPIDASKLPKLTKLDLSKNYFYQVTPRRNFPACDQLKINCVLVAKRPSGCPHRTTEMRSFKVCNGFCAASQIGGVCAGKGNCIILGPKKFACRCFSGYNNKKKRFTCVKN